MLDKVFVCAEMNSYAQPAAYNELLGKDYQTLKNQRGLPHDNAVLQLVEAYPQFTTAEVEQRLAADAQRIHIQQASPGINPHAVIELAESQGEIIHPHNKQLFAYEQGPVLQDQAARISASEVQPWQQIQLQELGLTDSHAKLQQYVAHFRQYGDQKVQEFLDLQEAERQTLEESYQRRWNTEHAQLSDQHAIKQRSMRDIIGKHEEVIEQFKNEVITRKALENVEKSRQALGEEISSSAFDEKIRNLTREKDAAVQDMLQARQERVKFGEQANRELEAVKKQAAEIKLVEDTQHTQALRGAQQHFTRLTEESNSKLQALDSENRVRAAELETAKANWERLTRGNNAEVAAQIGEARMQLERQQSLLLEKEAELVTKHQHLEHQRGTLVAEKSHQERVIREQLQQLQGEHGLFVQQTNNEVESLRQQVATSQSQVQIRDQNLAERTEVQERLEKQVQALQEQVGKSNASSLSQEQDMLTEHRARSRALESKGDKVNHELNSTKLQLQSLDQEHVQYKLHAQATVAALEEKLKKSSAYKELANSRAFDLTKLKEQHLIDKQGFEAEKDALAQQEAKVKQALAENQLGRSTDRAKGSWDIVKVRQEYESSKAVMEQKIRELNGSLDANVKFRGEEAKLKTVQLETQRAGLKAEVDVINRQMQLWESAGKTRVSQQELDLLEAKKQHVSREVEWHRNDYSVQSRVIQMEHRLVLGGLESDARDVHSKRLSDLMQKDLSLRTQNLGSFKDHLHRELGLDRRAHEIGTEALIRGHKLKEEGLQQRMQSQEERLGVLAEKEKNYQDALQTHYDKNVEALKQKVGTFELAGNVQLAETLHKSTVETGGQQLSVDRLNAQWELLQEVHAHQQKVYEDKLATKDRHLQEIKDQHESRVSRLDVANAETDVMSSALIQGLTNEKKSLENEASQAEEEHKKQMEAAEKKHRAEFDRKRAELVKSHTDELQSKQLDTNIQRSRANNLDVKVKELEGRLTNTELDKVQQHSQLKIKYDTLLASQTKTQDELNEKEKTIKKRMDADFEAQKKLWSQNHADKLKVKDDRISALEEMKREQTTNVTELTLEQRRLIKAKSQLVADHDKSAQDLRESHAKGVTKLKEQVTEYREKMNAAQQSEIATQDLQKQMKAKWEAEKISVETTNQAKLAELAGSRDLTKSYAETAQLNRGNGLGKRKRGRWSNVLEEGGELGEGAAGGALGLLGYAALAGLVSSGRAEDKASLSWVAATQTTNSILLKP